VLRHGAIFADADDGAFQDPGGGRRTLRGDRSVLVLDLLCAVTRVNTR
jgi:hypothetical protein